MVYCRIIRVNREKYQGFEIKNLSTVENQII